MTNAAERISNPNVQGIYKVNVARSPSKPGAHHFQISLYTARRSDEEDCACRKEGDTIEAVAQWGSRCLLRRRPLEIVCQQAQIQGLQKEPIERYTDEGEVNISLFRKTTAGSSKALTLT